MKISAMEEIAEKRRANCFHYDKNNPPHYSNVVGADTNCHSAPNAQGRGSWNYNTCPSCRNALQRIKRKRKRQEEKAAAEEKSLIRELLIREKKRADL